MTWGCEFKANNFTNCRKMNAVYSVLIFLYVLTLYGTCQMKQNAVLKHDALVNKSTSVLCMSIGIIAEMLMEIPYFYLVLVCEKILKILSGFLASHSETARKVKSKMYN